MTKGPILDPLRQIKTSDLQVTSASILGGAELQQGQIATIAVSILLSRTVACLATRLRIYDTEGRCAFASRLQNLGALAQGRHCVNFFFIATLSAGQYVASFEFTESNTSTEENIESANFLGLHNLFVEFLIQRGVKNLNEDINANAFYYTSVPNAISIYRQMEEDKPSKSGSKSTATSSFPWPLAGRQVSWLDLTNTLNKIFCTPATDKHTDHTTPLTLLSPNSYKREFSAGMVPMYTQIGVADGAGVRSNGVAGFLLHGPYLSVLPGRYLVMFKGKIGTASANEVIFDVAAKRGRSILTKFSHQLPVNGPLNISFEFEVSPPGFIDLEFRVNVGAAVELFIESVAVQPLLNVSERSTYKIENLLSKYLTNAQKEDNSNKFRQNTPSIDTQKNLTLVFIPNRVFTICGLIISHHLHKNSNHRIILVSEEDFNEALNASIKKLCGIEQCILLKNLKTELPDSKIDLVITHAENSFKQTAFIFKELSKRNSNAGLQVYSDGFRNAANTQKLTALRSVSKIYFFGIEYFASESNDDIPTEVIDFSTTQKVVTRFAQAHNFQGFEHPGRYNGYSVFCLRYWGLHGYNFPAKAVADSWYATISHHTPKEELIIIKGGGGHLTNNDSYAILKNNLSENGYKFIDADDYLASCGMDRGSAETSLEYLLYFGFFRQATRFFTLDSSLPIIMSHLDYLTRPVEIVSGAINLTELKIHTGFDVIKSNMRQLRQSFKKTQDLEPYEIIEEDEECFTIKLL